VTAASAESDIFLETHRPATVAGRKTENPVIIPKRLPFNFFERNWTPALDEASFRCDGFLVFFEENPVGGRNQF